MAASPLSRAVRNVVVFDQLWAAPCRYESGNAVKELLGTGHLRWDENKKQGAYAGQKVYDHTRANHSRSLEGPRGGERGARRGNAEPTAPAPAAFAQVGDFYGGDYCAPTQHANKLLAHDPQPMALRPAQRPQPPPAQDALDAWTANQYQEQYVRQEPSGAPRPVAAPVQNQRSLVQELQERHAAEASEEHVFGKSTAASILKTRPW